MRAGKRQFGGVGWKAHVFGCPPPGSGRVTFNNQRSYLKAVSAAFVEIKTTKFTKKVRGGLCFSWAPTTLGGPETGRARGRELSPRGPPGRVGDGGEPSLGGSGERGGPTEPSPPPRAVVLAGHH